MINLPDFKSVTVSVKTGETVWLLGREVFEKLKILRNESDIIGVYFTHYSMPPPHIRLGFRYTDWSKVERRINRFLDELKDQNHGLIQDIDKFEETTGEYYLLPKGVVSDYLACQSFDWLLRLENDLARKPKDAQRIAHWFMNNKDKIFEEIIDIHKNEFTDQEVFWMLERFIHHLLNSGWYYQIEPIILIYLSGSGFFKKPNLPFKGS